MPSWPGTLPQNFQVQGFSEQEPDLLLRSEMDAGPAKLRRRFTAGVRPVTTTLILTQTQKATLSTFFGTTLSGGALSFDWVLPNTATTATYRFTGPPVYQALGNNLFSAQLNLEVLP